LKKEVKPLKFIHIADVHLGAVPDSNMPWGPQREKEIWDSFQNIINICNEEQVELLLIAGDLFHRQPLLRELKEVNYILGKLNTAQVVLMAGNHDYIGPRSYYQEFEWNERVHMFLSDTIGIIEFPGLGAEVYGLSYYSRDITQPLYDTVRPEQNGKIHILLCHGNIHGNAHGGDDKNIPINRKKLSDSGFDYIALGHIHKPETLNNHMAYSGSIEPTDKNDLGERGYIMGEIIQQEAGDCVTSIRFVPNSARQYLRISLSINQDTTNASLLDAAKETIQRMGADNIYSFRLQGFRDERMHFDRDALMTIGNVLEVEDETVPDYDFDALYRDNSDNMIGMFIRKIRENTKQDEVAKKALYYGIEALLGAKG
jgi:DNA repair exonuclease SbcCD nuclease subunit